jgi:hypothetical protein
VIISASVCFSEAEIEIATFDLVEMEMIIRSKEPQLNKKINLILVAEMCSQKATVPLNAKMPSNSLELLGI